MPTVFELPTSATPQTQTINLGGTLYRITTRWNAFSACWMMDIADAFGNLLIGGVPLVTGANLLEQFAYLNLAGGGAMIVQSDSNPDLVPSATTLGTSGHLFYVAP